MAVRYLAALGLLAALGAGALQCIHPIYVVTALLCSPRQSAPCPTHEERLWTCCSTDPAAGPGRLPDLWGDKAGDKWGTPLFAGSNNGLGDFGVCLETAGRNHGLTTPGAEGCPVPCNPTWSHEDTEAVCGDGGFCCQVREITGNDCVLDRGCYRPATGAHRFDSALTGNTWGDGSDPWRERTHETHQDPDGSGCRALVEADPELTMEACQRTLGVANQRGFCFSTACKLDPDRYRDPCESFNEENGLVCDDDDDEMTSGESTGETG